MRRTWEVCPTPERMAQDIQRWELALEDIKSADGAIVEHLDNRTGRRTPTPQFKPHSCTATAVKVKEEKWASWHAEFTAKQAAALQ